LHGKKLTRANHLITVHQVHCLIVDRILMVSANTYCAMIPWWFR